MLQEEEMTGMIRLPGLVDAHVHLRTPGGSHKEDFNTGTAAALAGGFTTILDMPNTSPPTVDGSALDKKMAQAARQIRCDVGFFVGANNENAGAVGRLSPCSVGLKMYLGKTYGPLLISQLSVALSHFLDWFGPGPVAVHAKGLLLAGAIALARATDSPLHCCHIARREEIALIRAVKEQGARVTCEVTPHHLLLTEQDVERLGPLGYMKPTLGTEADRQALWDNIDVIDVIASDHAPHTREEKTAENPPPGVPGLETTLPLMLTAVHEGRLPMSRLTKMLSRNPGAIFGIISEANTWVELDTDAEWVLGDEPLYTRCGWTPFSGQRVRGKVRRVILRGQLVFEDGEILGEPGTGNIIRPPSNVERRASEEEK
jgi:dihydroorotase-like cyclic amidohydrolase